MEILHLIINVNGTIFLIQSRALTFVRFVRYYAYVRVASGTYVRLHSEFKCWYLSVKLRFVSKLQKIKQLELGKGLLGRLRLFAADLWSFAVISCFSNYGLLIQTRKGPDILFKLADVRNIES